MSSGGTRTAGGTVERILAGALDLLNRDGGAGVTTNHLAAHLGMSPGNLYYHFRNREEIVRAIFPHIEAEGLAATGPTEGPQLTAEDFGARHVRGVHVLWRFRFFFRDLNQLIARDDDLGRRFRDYETRLHAQYRDVFEQLIVQGDMERPAGDGDLDRLVAASIVVWTSWIAHLSVLRARGTFTRADAVEGALLSFLVVEPRLKPPFAATVRSVIEAYRNDDTASGASPSPERTRRRR